MRTEAEQIEYWSAEAAKLLVGRKIVDASYHKMDDSETLLIVLLDDGTALLPMRDDEGNGPGALHWHQGETKSGILGTLR